MKQDDLISRFCRWVTTHNWLVFIVSIVVVMGFAAGIKHLSFNSNYRIFFSQDNPQLKAYEQLERDYNKTDNILMVLEPKNGDVFTRENLAAVQWLTAKAWNLPNSSRVDSISNYQYSSADGDTVNVHNLVPDDAKLSDADLKSIRDIATHDPFLTNRLVSEKGHVTGVNITIRMPDTNTNQEIAKVVGAVRDLRASFEKAYPDIKVHLTGNVMMSSAFQDAARSDMRDLMPIMFGVVILTLIITLRTPLGAATTFVMIVASILVAMGAAGWSHAVLSGPVASAPIIILTMAVSDSVHLIATAMQFMRTGMDKRAAMAESLRINFGPVWWTSITTFVGFLTMNFSDSPPFHLLGNVVAAGVAAAWLFSVTLVPALFAIMPIRVKVDPDMKTDEHHVVQNSAMNALASFVLNFRTPLLVVMTALVAASMYFIPKNEFNDEFHLYFDKSFEFRRDTDFTIANLTGVYLIDYSVKAGSTEGDVNNPAYLKKLDDFANWYRQQPEVLHVNTFSDIMKRLNKNMHGDDPAMYTLPDARDLAAQYLLLYELSLPLGLDLTNQVNLDHSATRLTVTLRAVSSNEMIAIEKRASDWLKANGLASMKDGTGSGAGMMFAHIGKKNARSMLFGNLIALVVISFMLIFAFRTLKIGAVSMIPNLVPAVFAYGVWGAFNGEIGMSLSMVSGMTLGIVVDDTIHFLYKYLHARRKYGYGAEDAVRYAFNTVGNSMWITSVILTAGFMVLSISHFKMNSDMGLMTSATIVFALVADYFLLAPLLLLLAKHEKRAS